jgi:hypothetical protein
LYKTDSRRDSRIVSIEFESFMAASSSEESSSDSPEMLSSSVSLPIWYFAGVNISLGSEDLWDELGEGVENDSDV